ncbi:PolC-type DNA polymerase III [Candidatus Pelagibacter bacterium nBUS_27]|uniref:3'-5' exonuclease n=1 Tax=Candidatus Pelagibacter bacterium nBUS_27 TaxID=3374188 RepID=UPI003EB807F2
MKSIFNKIKYYFEKQKLFNRVTLEQSNFAILDTETTGLRVSKGDKVVSVASIKISEFKIREDVILDELVNPQIKIPEQSTMIHNIKDEDVKDKPTLIEIEDKILKFIKKSVLVGHNIDFDIKFLKNNAKNTNLANRMKVIQPIDTIHLTAGLFPDLKNYELTSLCEHFNIKADDQVRHSALGDCWLTARLFLFLLNKAKNLGITNITGLIKLCDRGLNLHHIIKNAKNIH